MLAITYKINVKLHSNTSFHVTSRQRCTSWTMHSLGTLWGSTHTLGRQFYLFIKIKNHIHPLTQQFHLWDL